MTSQEIQILELLAAGRTKREIAFQLNMWSWSVHRRIKQMLQRSGARNPVQLVSWATAARFVRPVPPADGARLLTGHHGEVP